MAIAAPRYYIPKFTDGTFSAPNYGSEPFLSGFEINIPSSGGTQWASGGTQFTVSPGCARAYSNEYVISYNPFLSSGITANLELDLNNHGALGCYPTPLESANLNSNVNSFAIYVLGDSSGQKQTTAIVVTGNNFLIDGYDCWRRIGTILISGASKQLLQVTQTGSGLDREYVALQRITGVVYGPTSFFIIPLSPGEFPWASPLVNNILYRMEFTSASPSDFATITPYGFATNLNELPFKIKGEVPGEVIIQNLWIPAGKTSSGANIQFVTVSGAGSTLGAGLMGWRETMSLEVI